MKIVLLFLLSICATLRAEPPRIKIRTPPFYRRMPSSPQQFLTKKWYQPPRPQPVRTRPIPVHMPSTHKIPMGMPQAPPRAVAPPIRTFWKNTQSPMKFAFPEKVYHKTPMHVPEQMFIKAPTTNFLDQEFDHQIQTNIIPATHTKSIKQVGEIGPIHTIPAPNLSLKDKPIIVNDARQDYSYQHSSPYLKAEKIHYYQVTEQPEQTNSMNDQELQRQFQEQQLRQQQMHQQKIRFQIQQQQQQQQQLHIQQQIEQHLQQKGHILDDIQVQPQQLYYEASTPVQTIQQPPGEIFLGNNISPKDLYQIIKTTYPQSTDSAQQQQQNLQMFQHEQNFDMSTAASDHKSRIQPEYHSFNYNEQEHQASQKNNLAKKELSSLVTAGYNLQGDTGEIVPRNPLKEPEVVHGFFENRSELERNDVEPQQKVEEEKIDEQLLGSSHYSSLPNQEAADRLTKLQTAGKINSNLMQLAENDNQASEIYLVENNDGHGQNNNDDSNSQTVEYEQYLQNNANNDEELNFEFGDRIKSTKT